MIQRIQVRQMIILLLDEEETFIREYRQRLVEDGFW